MQKNTINLWQKPIKREIIHNKKVIQHVLNDFFVVAREGFEPPQTEPKSVVLPLYYRAVAICECKDNRRLLSNQTQFLFFGNPRQARAWTDLKKHGAPNSLNYKDETITDELIFLINPCNTLPGPHSVNSRAPSVTSCSMDCVQRTGDVN